MFPLPIILAILGVSGLGGVAYYRKKVLKKGILTPDRKKAFDLAMTKVTDAAKLNKLSAIFKKEGLHAEAKMLQLRAKLRSLPAVIRQGRQDIYRKALASKDPQTILKVAAAFEKEGATAAATELRNYASGLSR